MTQEPCPSDWALERHLLGEMPGNRAGVANHVATCAVCQVALATKRADGERYLLSPEATALRHLLAARDAAAAAPRSRMAARRRLLAAGLAAAVLACVVAEWASHRAPQPVEEERAIMDLERDWSAAVVNGDVATLDRILADNYETTDSHGNVTSKAEELRGVGDHVVRYSVYDSRDLAVRVDGDHAVVTGRMTLKGVTVRGKTIDTDVEFADTLARIDGRWRATSARVTKSSRK